jgi:hypothetical protein
MATHEVLTLQLGGYANFVGAHFWNFQARIASPAVRGMRRRGGRLMARGGGGRAG